ncbi:hypothetical protein F9802_05725 [Bacillus aerolatus]|uniref:Uncharacterized protein n=1 Tax=Bacillus aerolatus TaxID=2653354 RepID=A0A6I1FIH6_9BACI|nr:hypothetical protein [Bacillus aerolatus]KAB7708200.1 hypothetical protein F9802_05725 [Bacillus aerolatus]
MVVKSSSIKTANFMKPFTIIICFILLFIGLSFYFYYKEQMNELAYAEKMEMIYKKMDETAVKAEAVVSSYPIEGSFVNRRGEGMVAGKNNSLQYFQDNGVIEKLEKESEECHDMLYELAEPPERLTEAYSVLLDAHITYKQYIQLALHPQKQSDSFIKKARSLKEELNSRLILAKNRIAQL